MLLTRHETPRAAPAGRSTVDSCRLSSASSCCCRCRAPAWPTSCARCRAARAPSAPAAGADRADAGGVGRRRDLPAQPRGARGRVDGQGRLRARLRGEAPRAVLQGDRLARRRATSMPIRVRDDSAWNVPEPELTLVVNARGEIVGYTRRQRRLVARHRGREPALPAAGQGLQRLVRARSRHLTRRRRPAEGPADRSSTITRGGRSAFQGETRTSQIKRSLDELADYLAMELDFPRGAFLMTGTGIVPPARTSRMTPGDVVAITIGGADARERVAGERSRGQIDADKAE